MHVKNEMATLAGARIEILACLRARVAQWIVKQKGANVAFKLLDIGRVWNDFDDVDHLNVPVEFADKRATIQLHLQTPIAAGSDMAASELSEAAESELKALALREIQELAAAIHRVPITND